MSQKVLDQHIEDAAILVINAWNADESAAASLQSYCLENNMLFSWEFRSVVSAHAKKIWINSNPS